MMDTKVNEDENDNRVELISRIQGTGVVKERAFFDW